MAGNIVVVVSVVLFLAVMTATMIIIAVALPRLRDEVAWPEADEQRLSRLAGRSRRLGNPSEGTADPSGSDSCLPARIASTDRKPETDVPSAETGPVRPHPERDAEPGTDDDVTVDSSGTRDLAGLSSGGGPADRPEPPR